VVSQSDTTRGSCTTTTAVAAGSKQTTPHAARLSHRPLANLLEGCCCDAARQLSLGKSARGLCSSQLRGLGRRSGGGSSAAQEAEGEGGGWPPRPLAASASIAAIRTPPPPSLPEPPPRQLRHDDVMSWLRAD
jgi:hypothetical protein